MVVVGGGIYLSSLGIIEYAYFSQKIKIKIPKVIVVNILRFGCP